MTSNITNGSLGYNATAPMHGHMNQMLPATMTADIHARIAVHGLDGAQRIDMNITLDEIYLLSVIDKLDGQVMAWEETAKLYSKNAEFYRDIIIRMGEHFGREAHRCGDGSESHDPLILKVEQLVHEALLKLNLDIL